MASSVSFRMFHGKQDQLESILFSGNSIQLLDLKREILDRKKMSSSLDFDLKIIDENGKEFKDDNEYVPKNSSLVVKRVPVTNQSKSLVSKLRGGQQTEIVIPAKVELAPVELVETPLPAPPVPAVSSSVVEEKHTPILPGAPLPSFTTTAHVVQVLPEVKEDLIKMEVEGQDKSAVEQEVIEEEAEKLELASFEIENEIELSKLLDIQTER